MTVPRRGGKRTNYNRLRDTNDTPGLSLNEPLSPETEQVNDDPNSNESPTSNTHEGGTITVSPSVHPNVSTPLFSSPNVHNTNETVSDAEPSISKASMVVIILDSLHNRFRVPAEPEWTVERFKSAGASVHKVAARSQRLIFMGRLLQENKTLRESGIDETELIVHLFPKPNVVVTHTTPANSSSDNRDDRPGDNPAPSVEDFGAHIPQIQIDAEEARRSSSMILFTSSEMFEAQHRVKLFSFLLLIISSMELLTLLTIFLGFSDYGANQESPPGDPTDEPFARPNPDMQELRQWQNSDYFDFVNSALEFYVATLGIQATTDNTHVLARKYFVGLVVVGFGWVGYYYYLNTQVMQKEAKEDNEELTGGQLFSKALSSVSLPIVVWAICFLRAWQFQSMIQEAELETEVRLARIEADEETGGEEERSINDLRLVIT